MVEAEHTKQLDEAQSMDEPLREPLSSLGVELTRISAEIQSIHSGFQVQLQQALGEVHSAIETQYRARFEQAMAETRHLLESQFKNRVERAVEEQQEHLRQEIQTDLQVQFQAELNQKLGGLARAHEEIARVTTVLENISQEISSMIDDPSIELSRVMRKKAEQGELRAYLNGLLFSTGER